MTIKSPYNFVPVSNEVHYPDLQHYSQDLPLKEGVSGIIELEIKNLNELIVGGTKSENDRFHPFFKTLDNKPAIPGTSLKGMLRNIIEVASGGYIRMDDNQFSQRDLTSAKNDYMKTLRAKRAGWLLWDEQSQTWKIAPTKNSKYKTIRHTFDVTHNEKNANTDVEHILQDLLPNVVPPIHQIENAVERYEEILKAKPNATKIGAAVEVLNDQYLVVTNQLQGCSKRREFLFSGPNLSAAREVPKDVLQKFEWVMDKSQTEIGSEHWQFLKQFHLEGIPVFYLIDSKSNIAAFGLPSLFRLPYENTLFDLIPTSHKQQQQKHLADFADRLFGETPTGEQTSFARKGRVSIGLATSNSVGQFREDVVVLSNPKPSYYPTYLKQRNGDLKNYNAAHQINGFKQYLPHQTLKHSRIPLQDDGTQNLDVTKTVEVLESSHTFNCKIRLHNLAYEEVGALIWALTWGEAEADASNYIHLLGMGKPLGYGQVKISIKNCNLQNNDVNKIMLTKEDFINRFYVYLGVNNLLNENLATLKAAHKPGVVADSELAYMVLDPNSGQDDFLKAREDRLSLQPLQIDFEKNQIQVEKEKILDQIQQHQQIKEAREQALKEQQAAAEQAEKDRLVQVAKQEMLASRSAFEVLFEDAMNSEITKKTLNLLVENPALYQSLSGEDKAQLKTKIEVNPWFKGLKNKRKKWRDALPDLLR